MAISEPMPHAATTSYQFVLDHVAAASDAAGRLPGAIKLVAVSKSKGPEDIRPILAAGHRVFGENRVQEAATKWPDLKAAFPGIELHLIGPLQTNKAAEAVSIFDVIHTVDRMKLLIVLAKEMRRQNCYPSLLVQVNTGLEPQKAGLAASELGEFLAAAKNDHGISFAGLMCIPPVTEDPMPHFRQLAALARRQGLSELSMGMSADYATAIAEGATMIRIGSAIFGARPAASPLVAR